MLWSSRSWQAVPIEGIVNDEKTWNIDACCRFLRASSGFFQDQIDQRCLTKFSSGCIFCHVSLAQNISAKSLTFEDKTCKIKPSCCIEQPCLNCGFLCHKSIGTEHSLAIQLFWSLRTRTHWSQRCLLMFACQCHACLSNAFWRCLGGDWRSCLSWLPLMLWMRFAV